ncbi:hypothetical protein A4R35_19715 [Thermogemmatispora tikiterensis]|uniref:Pectate lyase domain-containing protein n=1 Tax=Thermogemmatispora tikiterensis TaxID=1825093 RepID=A0A328VJY6_9CHLR|nr:hypothetical protein [Thermogemmatispora tikiterensis]RAQ97777.1 hypothetical protein A4R35_19715 [Thermogemmatispora tikiterensis]
MRRILSRKLFWVVMITLLVLVGGGLALVPVFLGTHTAAAAPVDQLVGYGAGTTGGAGGSVTTVSTLSALQNAVKGSSPKIVYVSGTITGDTDVDVGSNTSIIGVGSTASLVGISLSIKDVSNVIIRNLSISFVRADGNTSGDAIHIEHSQYIWVDHNNLFSDMDHGKDYYDGLIDITHAADYITVSWNRLHDHYKVSLVGHSDSNAAEDTGHLHVTYHHNWFYNVNSRLPSLRFGTGHIYNNYYQNVDDSAIHSRMGAQVLVENNVFRNVDVALTTTGDSPQDGFTNARGNDYGGATVDITQVGTFTTAPYNYTLDPVSDVINEVTTYSGVGVGERQRLQRRCDANADSERDAHTNPDADANGSSNAHTDADPDGLRWYSLPCQLCGDGPVARRLHSQPDNHQHGHDSLERLAADLYLPVWADGDPGVERNLQPVGQHGDGNQCLL